jgi:hypothetical protein
MPREKFFSVALASSSVAAEDAADSAMDAMARD